MTTQGCVVAFPGADDQHFHADGPDAFFNAFVPLVDVADDMGPTQFALGTHDDPHAVSRAPTLEFDDDAQLVAPLLSRGDCLLFDWRLLHRGRANTSHMPRPLFYATFTPPGRTDDINFLVHER